MADLFNQQISATYSGLLKTSSSGVLSASLSQITDGRGNVSQLYLSTTSVQFYGLYTFPNSNGSNGQVLKTDGAGVLTWENDSLSNTLNFQGNSASTGSITLDTQTFSVLGTDDEIVTFGSNQYVQIGFPTAGVTLPNGSIATTQTASDNSTKVATTAYVDNQVSSTGTVTSVALSVPTGLTVTGSPITTSGTITIGGTLGVANGGTGATTLTGILLGNGTSAISSVTDGTVGQVLSTNGSGTYSFIDAGTGDVTVDGASVGNRVAVWNNTTGELRGTSAIATENSNIYLIQPSTNGTDKFNYIIGGAFAINENDFGIQNTGFGYRVLNSSDFTGNNNTAFGSESQTVLTPGLYNTSIGSFAMYDNRSGSYNVGLGGKTMFNQRISNYNVAIGYDSMDGVSASQTAISNYNTAIGHESLQSIQGGDNNTVIGYNSGSAITTGSKNVIIGSNTGSTIATSSNNIIISDGDGNIRQSFDINGDATFSGNVGVGIAPSKKLTVFGTGVGNSTVQIEGEGGADPYINFLVNNAKHWALGVDDSDSDKFKISEHSALGTNDRLTISAGGLVSINTGLQLLNFSGRDTIVQAANDPTNANIYVTQGGVGDFSQLSGSLVLQARTQGTIYRDIIFAGGLGSVAEPATQLMTIKGEGNVGIGTDSPSALLSLGNGVDAQKLLLYDDGNFFKYGFGIQSGELRQFFPNSATAKMTFGTISDSDGTTYSPKLTIESNGQTTFKSTTDYKIGLIDSANTTQWWFKAYTSGNFALHKNGVGDSLTITSGGDATFNGDISLVNETTTTSQATLAIKGKQTTSANNPVGEIVFFNNNDSFATIAGVRDGANDKGALLFQTQNGTAGFGTRLTISSGGVTTINATAANGSNLIVKNLSNDVPYGMAIELPNGSSDSVRYLYYGGVGTAAKFKVATDGTIYAVDTTVRSVSDVRFKENIRDLDTGLSQILQLKPRLFDWKEGKGMNIKDAVGFIAQEVEEILPKLVDNNWSEDGLDEKGAVIEGVKYKTVGQTGLIPTLVKAIQEQQTIIEDLKSRIETLEG